MLENLVTYFQVKDDSLELICEDAKTGLPISTARYPLDILAMELKPFLDNTHSSDQVYLNLTKDNFYGTTIVTGYNLCKIKVIRTYVDDDGYSWTDGTCESGNKIKVKTDFVFRSEDRAKVAANSILETNRSLMVGFYKKLMKNLESIDKAMIISPEYVKDIKNNG